MVPPSEYSMKEVFAVLVLYNCKLESSTTFRSLTTSLKMSNEQLDILIYDNSPTRNVEKKEYLEWDIHYIHNPSNPGVSKAYNIGCKLARQLEKKWLLLLDQDTLFPKDTIILYKEALKRHSFIPIMAPRLKSKEEYLSPCSHFPMPTLQKETLEEGEYGLKDIYLLNSGLLVKISAFELSGGYIESIKLDFSDFAFLHRLKKHFKSFYLLDLTAEHEFFNNSKKTPSEMAERFKYYCQGARAMSLETGNIFYRIKALIRGIKLSLQYRSIRFIKLFALNIGGNDDL